MRAEFLETTEPVASFPERPVASSTRGWTNARFACLLLAFVFASYPDVLLGGRTFFFRDFGYFGYPLVQYWRESILSGQWPLWNPLNNCGLPFLAQWNTMALYPPMLFCLVLPLAWALPVLNLAHLVWGGMGMRALVAERSRGSWGPVLAGVAFCFGGLMVNCLMWPNNVGSLAWMPWIVLTVSRAWRRGGRSICTAAICGGLQMLSGGGEIILLTWLIVAGLGLCAFFSGEIERKRFVGRGLILVAVVCGLTAVQLWPFFQLLSFSHRSAGFADSAWSMPISGWVNFLLPLFHTSPFHQGVHFLEGQAWTTSYYLGAMTVVMAVVGLLRNRSREIWGWSALAIAGLIFAWGDAGGLYAWVKSWLPALGFMRFPIKFIVLTTFALCFVVGRTLSWFESLEWERRRQEARWWLGCAAGVGLLMGAILFLGGNQPAGFVGNGLVRLLLLTLIAVAFWLGWVAPVLKQPWIARLSMVVLLWIDLMTHTPRQNPTAESWIYRADATAGFLPNDPRPEFGVSRAMMSPEAKQSLRSSWLDDPEDQYVSRRTGLLNNCNLVDHISKVDGFFSLYPAVHVDVVGEIYARQGDELRGLSDFMGVSHVTRAGAMFDWEQRPTFRPFICVGQTPQFLDEDKILAAVLASTFDPSKTVYLPLAAQSESASAAQATTSILETTAHRWRVKVNADKACWVTIAQTWYPCWQARVDGVAVQLWRANHAFQAVAVPAGEHELELVYEDRRFWWGGFVSAATWCGCIWVGRSRRNRGGDEDEGEEPPVMGKVS